MLFSTKQKWTNKPWKKSQRNLNALPREKNQSEKTTSCMIPTIWHFEKGKTRETVNDQCLPGIVGMGWGRE